VWSRRPDAGVKFAEVKSAQPGLDKTISADDGGKTARSPRRARRKPLKPLRAGMPGDSGVLVVTRVRSLPTQSAREAAGAAGTRHSPRPLLGGRFFARLGRIASRGANVCLELTVIASAERRADFGPVHSRITALRIPRRRLRTVFVAGMPPTFIDRSKSRGRMCKTPKARITKQTQSLFGR
jgi:hypothetical protein